MKTKYNNIILAILLSSIFLQASAQVEISGQVKDNSTKEALMYCSIRVHNLQDSLITGGVTNDKGFFKIP
ncbi:MAG: hypothetical protein QM503_15775 [Bacteroidota bacterium]